MSDIGNKKTVLMMRDILVDYLAAGREQLARYQKNHSMDLLTIRDQQGDSVFHKGKRISLRDVQRQLMIDRDIFVFLLLESFWNYFELRINSIETPASNGIDRALFEICYQRIIPIISLSDSVLHEKIIQTHLCDIGIILSSPTNDPKIDYEEFSNDYDFFTAQFQDQKLIEKYGQLKLQKYPLEKFAKLKHQIWGGFYKSLTDNESLIRLPFAGNTKELREAGINTLAKAYIHLHDFIHGDNSASRTAVSNQISKSHLFSAYTFITPAAYQVLATTNEIYLHGDEVDLNRIIESSPKVVPYLAEHFSTRNVDS